MVYGTSLSSSCARERQSPVDLHLSQPYRPALARCFKKALPRLLSILVQGIETLLLVSLLSLIFPKSIPPMAKAEANLTLVDASNQPTLAVLPDYSPAPEQPAIARQANPHTQQNAGQILEATTYKVAPGDSIDAIADHFGLQRETILWANSAQLNDNPRALIAGQQLIIPPGGRGVLPMAKRGHPR